MKKRILSFLIAFVLLLTLIPASALAADYVKNNLNASHKGAQAGDDFNGIASFDLNNPLKLVADVDDATADFAFWHFIDSSKKASYAEVTYQTEAGELVAWRIYPSGGGQHYAVITPSAWILVDGTSYSSAAGNFNLSHSGKHEASVGTVSATAKVTAYHNEITPHEEYSRDVYKCYVRTVDEYYERPVEECYVRTVCKAYTRTVDEYYTRTVDEFYERCVAKYLSRDVDLYYERNVDEYYVRNVDQYFERYKKLIYNRYAQKYLVPVFEKETESYVGTLVTRVYDDKGKLYPGAGVFKNGHTYVAVDVAAASAEGGVDYVIADSSKKSGKKTPYQYNKPIGQTYNVQIKDSMITISVNGNLAGAQIGAYVVASPSKFPGNAPAHNENSVTLKLPAGTGNTVYLYTHIASAEWYLNNGEYKFVEWRYDPERTVYGEYQLEDTQYGEYELVDTVYGDYELDNTEYGNYELVNTVYGDYELDDTEYGKYELVDTKYGEYTYVETKYGDYVLAKTVYGDPYLYTTIYGDYELVKTVYGDYTLYNSAYGEYKLDKAYNTTEKVADLYDGKLTLTVNGEVKPLDEKFELKPGIYSFVLSGPGFEAITKTVEIVAGDNGLVDFGTITVKNDDVILETVVTRADRKETAYYTDLKATVHKADKAPTSHVHDYVKESWYDLPVTIHKDDLPATVHEKDLEAVEIKSDREATVHESDRAAVRHESDQKAEEHYSDQEAEEIYNEAYIYLEDIRLGSETDPDSEYAVKLN